MSQDSSHVSEGLRGSPASSTSPPYNREDVQHYYRANLEIESSRHRIEDATQEIRALEHSEAVELFQKQVGLLQKRLVGDPKFFQQVFISEGTNAIAWEFQKEELDAGFIRTLWNLLLRGDDMSALLQRFIWNIPLKFKRKFVRAIDLHLSDRYPMFRGLSQGWPGTNSIPPYIRPPEERVNDFDLVNQGYLGYMGLGYSLREVELLVWLEVLRDKQCDDRPCELGVPRIDGGENKGGCPVKIHIPEVLRRRSSARGSAPRTCGRSRSASWSGICPRARRSPIPTRCSSVPRPSTRGPRPRSRRSPWWARGRRG